MKDPDVPFDLLVIGGGINGAGIARDAALRGLKVCIVDADDWGSGTSSRSSMLAHGGLRYLEQFELGLVHEALQERERMFRLAPHLVRPLEFVYPIYPHIANRRTVRAGLFLYDLLSHGKTVPKRGYLDAGKVVRRLPGIQPDELLGGATYFDGQWRSVERFVLELILDAEANGAVTIPHCKVERLIMDAGRCAGVQVAGQTEEAAQRLTDADVSDRRILARWVVNAAGPWVDHILDPQVASPPLIRGTKGSHIVVPRFVEVALIIRAKDGRTFFIIPWNQHCLVGTTDIDDDGRPEDCRASAAEVEYLIESARFYFPDAPLDDIQWTYAGVRPLVNETGLTEGNVTRKHVIHDHASDGASHLLSIQGGKLTTYRHLAEEVVDIIAKGTPAARRHPSRGRPLPGAPVDIDLDDPHGDAALESELQDAKEALDDAEMASHLVSFYGTRWRRVVGIPDPASRETPPAPPAPDAAQRIDAHHPAPWGMVDLAIREEHAMTIADVLLRRSYLGLYADVAKAVGKRMAKALDWDRARLKSELAAYATARSRHDVPPRT